MLRDEVDCNLLDQRAVAAVTGGDPAIAEYHHAKLPPAVFHLRGNLMF
jgi:hypothetical protein